MPPILAAYLFPTRLRKYWGQALRGIHTTTLPRFLRTPLMSALAELLPDGLWR